ncbi:MAG: TatD DNase family [Geobacteraceae bacterium]|nr:MAG: TatD DNase family [Geobacteraceae bacterium]
MFIDTHCHLDDSSLSLRLSEVLDNGSRAGVERYIVPGVDPAGWEGIAALADTCPDVYPAFGLHPLRADLYNERLPDRLETILKRAVAVGEIGLDYTRADLSREAQIVAFRGQLRSAVTAGLPVLIHCRKAFEDLLRILREEGVRQVGGVMHAFSGSPEVARECIRLGFYISVAGTVTYRNAVKPLEVVRSIPLEYLMLETDAPDMTPEPYRGLPNEPAFIVETGKKVAEIKGISLDEVAAVTTGNAERLFRFKPLTA